MKTKKISLVFAFILGFVGFVTSFGAHIVAVNLPEYAKEVGVGMAMIGLLIAAYDFAEIIAKPIFGSIADRQGMKRTLLIGYWNFYRCLPALSGGSSPMAAGDPFSAGNGSRGALCRFPGAGRCLL